MTELKANKDLVRITTKNMQRFYDLRERFLKLVDKEVEDSDGYYKSYEGAINLVVGYPNVFEDDYHDTKPNLFSIQVHCYLLINGRHENFDGDTFKEALDKFEYQIKEWEIE